MSLRKKPLKFGWTSLVGFFAASIYACALSPGAYAENPKAIPEALSVSASIQRSAGLTATLLTINGVLARLDRSEGRGRNATRLASLRSSNTLTDIQPSETEISGLGTEPFGLFPFRAPEGILSRNWRRLESDLIKEQKVLNRCRADADGCPSYVAQFLRLISAIKSKSGRAQLDQANRSVNAAIRYVTDFSQYGQADRWSAPLATFSTAKGDCEDYAIAKYIALRDAGFPSDDLRVVMGRARTMRQDHAVLAARLEGRWLILDNQRSELIEDSRMRGFTVLFTIGHRGVFLLAGSRVEHPVYSDGGLK